MKLLFLALLALVSWAITAAVLVLCARLCMLAASNRSDLSLRVIAGVILVVAVGSGVGVFLSFLASRKAGS